MIPIVSDDFSCLQNYLKQAGGRAAAYVGMVTTIYTYRPPWTPHFPPVWMIWTRRPPPVWTWSAEASTPGWYRLCRHGDRYIYLPSSLNTPLSTNLKDLNTAPSSCMDLECGGMDPGVIPPMSAWWPRLATKEYRAGNFTVEYLKKSRCFFSMIGLISVRSSMCVLK